jgi:hypothetical protein
MSGDMVTSLRVMGMCVLAAWILYLIVGVNNE